MNFDKLDRASADPRPRWKALAEDSAALRLRGIPDADCAYIVSLRAPLLDAQLTQIYETWGSTEEQAQAALADFDSTLMADARVYYERARKAGGDGIDDLTAQFVHHRYAGVEIEGLRILLSPGERAERVGWLSVQTNQQRSISRSAMRDAAQPTTWSRAGTWESQFIPLDRLAEMEREEAETAARQAAPIVGGRNLDLPNPRGRL